ncbi:MAG TPA: PQQ-dependent sugar dehydrogenase [Leadbetterella sp.]|nr:PQQ-dependent sugar dehydrogenase [Leadbetterella sp.]
MKKVFLLVSFSILSFNSYSKLVIPSDAKTDAVFSQYCSSCHGEKIEAFVDRKWKYGTTKPEIIKTISNGAVDAGMPSWKNTLSPKQIEKLADQIVLSLKNVDQYKFSAKPKSNIFTSGSMTLRLDTMAVGFDSPWGITQLPNGELLITDRSGKLYKIDKNKTKIEIKNTPTVLAKGQGGLLDVELHPNYLQNGWVYLSYSKFKEENGATLTTTALVRGKIVGDQFTESNEIFEAKPYTKTTHHYGSRIVFDGNGYLFLSVGERGKHFEYAQGTDNDLGKIHRIHDDGRIPADNPFVGKESHSQTLYTYGNRNPQGLTQHPVTKEIWEHEHGPRGGDEINILKKGTNYGWPAISYGINYDGKPITNLSKKEGMEQPLHYYLPSIAPSGMTFVTSDKYPSWKGSLILGSLRFNYLERVVLKDTKVVENHKELLNIGRMRSVKMGSDGYIYLGVENPGMVFRLIPSSK